MTEATPVYLRQRDLEARWSLSGRTLERWRAENCGPPWYVIGNSIRYRLADVEAFERHQRHGACAQRLSSLPEGGPQ